MTMGTTTISTTAATIEITAPIAKDNDDDDDEDNNDDDNDDDNNDDTSDANNDGISSAHSFEMSRTLLKVVFHCPKKATKSPLQLRRRTSRHQRLRIGFMTPAQNLSQI